MNDNDIVTSVTPKNTTITLQPIPEQLLTVKDVAKLLECNVATVHKLRRAGVIRFLKLGAYKCRVSTFLQFLEDYDGKDLSEYTHDEIDDDEKKGECTYE